MVLHEVLTAEKVPFSYRVAGLGSRLLAWLVDLGLIVLLLFAGNLAAGVLEIGRQGLGMALFVVWSFCILWGYFLLFEWLWHGQTPGKRLLGLRVLDLKGTGLSFSQAAVRNVLRPVDGLPFLPLPVLYTLGFVVAACNRENRRLGDLAAGTLVVHLEGKSRPFQALAGGRELDRAGLAQVRQRLGQLGRAQKQTLLDLCLRRDQLRVEERVRLFGAVAEFFRHRLDLVPEPYQSEEKFVLQLAAVLGSEVRSS